MNFRDLLRIANRNLLRSKLRTFLTIMAIFVGSFTLVLTNAIGDGARNFADKQVRTLEGNNVFFVRKKYDMPRAEKSPEEVPEYKEEQEDPTKISFDPKSFSLTKTQVEANTSEFSEIKSVTPNYSIESEYISIDGGKRYVIELGMLSEGLNQKTEAGSSINGTNQILIPMRIAKTVSENYDALIGKTATIGYKIPSGEMRTVGLKIVGISTKGIIESFNAFVDVETARKIYEEQKAGDPEVGKFSRFTLLLDENTSEERRNEIREKLDEKGLSAESFADQRRSREEGLAIFQIALNFFAFIALLAASFGIINTLVIAVMERTKEIGLQKAVGMGRKTIFALFSIESVLIGFWGAVAGIVAGMLVGTITNIILQLKYPDAFEIYSLFYFRPLSIFFIILLICIIAFIAGVFPAWKASKLDPIEALRYE